MAKRTRSRQPSEQNQEKAMRIARGTQWPEQTKLIAQGIQKGIEHYKKQQNIKARARQESQEAIAAVCVS
jgi:hypothetical protein